MDINPETITKSPFFIGALGALVGLRGVPGSTWGERAIYAAIPPFKLHSEVEAYQAQIFGFQPAGARTLQEIARIGH